MPNRNLFGIFRLKGRYILPTTTMTMATIPHSFFYCRFSWLLFLGECVYSLWYGYSFSVLYNCDSEPSVRTTWMFRLRKPQQLWNDSSRWHIPIKSILNCVYVFSFAITSMQHTQRLYHFAQCGNHNRNGYTVLTATIILLSAIWTVQWVLVSSAHKRTYTARYPFQIVIAVCLFHI